jgi:NADH-quinone oxidoreductase subunit A
MTPLAAYALLFVAVGIGFIFVHLMAGKFIRPNKPEPSKGTIYECGEPTIGSAWIQFDLRFYVVALLFVIFDVEVAFFFPWAEVFGKANAVTAVGQPTDAERYHQIAERAMPLVPPHTRADIATTTHFDKMTQITPEDLARLDELEARRQANEKLSAKENDELLKLRGVRSMAVNTYGQARMLGWLSLLEIAVFFGVLLVGFAYLWRRGDLAWVRSLAAERPATETLPASMPAPARQSAPLAGTGAPL